MMDGSIKKKYFLIRY